MASVIIVLQIVYAMFISGKTVADDAFAPRIVGGTLCNLTEYPFVISIFSLHSCGGTLVTLDWVLTAAHCIHPYRITNGKTILRSGFNAPLSHVQVRKSKRAVVHRKFNSTLMKVQPAELRYDIAMILANESFKITPTLNVVTLPQPGFTATCKWGKVLGSGVTAMIAYHGTRGFMDHPLRCVDLGIVNRDTCAKMYLGSVVDDTILCAGHVEDGKDACHGDSGGPLLCNERVIIGIVSFGKGCGVATYASTYTKVEKYLNFIQRSITLSSPLSPRSTADHHSNNVATTPLEGRTDDGSRIRTKNAAATQISKAISFLSALSLMKTLDANKYATKKTIAQGLLDVALLTANASQLKYVLQVGEKHEFYALMLSLISISIVLQVIQAILCVLLGTSLNLNKESDHSSANRANNVILCINIILMAVNILISSFEMKESTATT